MAQSTPTMPAYITGPILPSGDSIAAFSTSIIFGILAIIAVVFRLWAQMRTKAGITIDAYLIIAALIITLGICGLAAYMTLMAGYGWPLELLSDPVDELYLNCLNAHQLLWAIAVACIRASLLLFYRRIFTTAMFKKTVLAALCFNTIYLVIFIIITALSFSVPALAESSSNYTTWLIANGVIDMIQDLGVLCLPLFVIRKLQMSRSRKIGLVALFWLGAFCVVASIARVVYFTELLNPLLTDADQHTITGLCIIWSTIQPCTSIIAACLPTCAPLFRGDFALHTRFSSKFVSLLRSSRRSTPSNAESKMVARQASDDASRNTWDRMYSKNSSHVESGAVAEDSYDVVKMN